MLYSNGELKILATKLGNGGLCIQAGASSPWSERKPALRWLSVHISCLSLLVDLKEGKCTAWCYVVAQVCSERHGSCSGSGRARDWRKKHAPSIGTLPTTMADIKLQFEALLMLFSKEQAAMADLVETRSKLETQYQENKIVFDEFEYLDENSNIYKMTGPVLMPQDYNEAKMNVSKRMEFIQGEISRVEDKLTSAQKSLEDSRNKLLQIRNQMTQ